MLICILTKNVITSCSVTMMLFLHLEVKPLMTLTTVLYLDRKSGSAGMPRPKSYAVFCLKKKRIFNHLLIAKASSTVGTVVKCSFDNCISLSLVIFSGRSIDEN